MTVNAFNKISFFPSFTEFKGPPFFLENTYLQKMSSPEVKHKFAQFTVYAFCAIGYYKLYIGVSPVVKR